MTIDLSTLEVGDTVVLRCGGEIKVDKIETLFHSNAILINDRAWSTTGRPSPCDPVESPFDIVAIKKSEKQKLYLVARLMASEKPGELEYLWFTRDTEQEALALVSNIKAQGLTVVNTKIIEFKEGEFEF